MMIIEQISDLLPFVAMHDAFTVRDRGDYQFIDYDYQDQHTFDIPELMECRGIKFDRFGKLIARPFKKFFNYGERGCELPVDRPHYITEKLDGSMIHSVVIDDTLYFHTRAGHTDHAKKAERFVLSSVRCNYTNLARYACDAGWTPLFEWTGPNNRIVIRYDEAELTLLAMRRMIDGSLMSRDLLKAWSKQFKVPLVKEHGKILLGQEDDFIARTRDLMDAEGYVLYSDDGYMVKIKADDYVLKHRALDDLGSKKKVVALCAQGFHDDVLPVLGDEDKRELEDFNTLVQAQLDKDMSIAQWYRDVYLKFRRTMPAVEARKKFALTHMPVMPLHIKSCAFAMIDEKNARMTLIKHYIKWPQEIDGRWRGE